MNTSNSSKKTIRQKVSDILNIEKPWFRKVIKAVWILFLCVMLGVPLYIFLRKRRPVWAFWRHAKPESDRKS